MVAAAIPDNEPDWSGIRAASVAIGVREAARQAGKDLPPDEQERFVERVMKRCSREGWLVQAQIVRSTPRTQSQAKPLSAPVRTGADTVLDSIAEDGKATKVHAMKFAKRTVKYAASLAKTSPEQALAMAGDVKASLQSAAIAGDWQAKDTGGNVTLAFFSITGQDGPVIDV